MIKADDTGSEIMRNSYLKNKQSKYIIIDFFFGKIFEISNLCE